MMNQKVKDLDSGKYLKLKQVCSLKRVPVNRQIIQKYIRVIQTNKKQPQASKQGAGMNRVAHASGTNKGMSRMPHARFGYKTVKTNVPGTVKGRRALRYIKNQTSLKCNRKEKTLAVKMLLYLALTKAKVYRAKEFLQQNSRTSHKIAQLKSQVDQKFKRFLEDPKPKGKFRVGPCLIVDQRSPLAKVFKNYPNVIYLSDKSTHFYQLYRGNRLRSSLIFDQSALEKLLIKYDLIEKAL